MHYENTPDLQGGARAISVPGLSSLDGYATDKVAVAASSKAEN
jgi:hypothetical protein